MDIASSSKQPRMESPQTAVCDRLSTLPDDVLHMIFSNLDFLDVLRTCVLSKRWKYFWASLPYLNFNADWFVKYNCSMNEETAKSQYKFWDFVKCSLLFRDDNAQFIRLCVVIDSTMMGQLNKILCLAAKKKVQELCILDSDYAYGVLNLPHNLCESLVKLTLKFRDVVPVWVASVFSNLVSLTLVRVSLRQDSIEKLLSRNCTKIEDVHLEDCQVEDVEEIDVSAGNLKNLLIVNLSTFGKFWAVGCFDCKIRISAPNLKSFAYVGPMLRGLAFVDTTSLEKLAIRILRIPLGYQRQYKNHSLGPKNLIGLNYAKNLILSSVVVKHFCPMYNKIVWDTFLLGSLRRLDLQLRYSPIHMEGLINLLEFTPNLEALSVRFKKGRQPSWTPHTGIEAAERRGTWRSRVEFIPCLFYNVATIQLSLLHGEEMALELLRFLLINGKVIKKMEILHVSAEMKQEYVDVLKKFYKASSEVVISFPKLRQKENIWFDKGDSDSE